MAREVAQSRQSRLGGIRRSIRSGPQSRPDLMERQPDRTPPSTSETNLGLGDLVIGRDPHTIVTHDGETVVTWIGTDNFVNLRASTSDTQAIDRQPKDPSLLADFSDDQAFPPPSS